MYLHVYVWIVSGYVQCVHPTAQQAQLLAGNTLLHWLDACFCWSAVDVLSAASSANNAPPDRSLFKHQHTYMDTDGPKYIYCLNSVAIWPENDKYTGYKLAQTLVLGFQHKLCHPRPWYNSLLYLLCILQLWIKLPGKYSESFLHSSRASLLS